MEVREGGKEKKMDVRDKESNEERKGESVTAIVYAFEKALCYLELEAKCPNVPLINLRINLFSLLHRYI